MKRVQGGETADVVIIPRQGIDGLVKDGKVAADNVTVTRPLRPRRSRSQGRAQA